MAKKTFSFLEGEILWPNTCLQYDNERGFQQIFKCYATKFYTSQFLLHYKPWIENPLVKSCNLIPRG